MTAPRAQPGYEASPSLSAHEFAAQFASIFPRLWGLAAALIGDRSEAEDLVQESALVALSKLETFTPGSNFQAWMARIVRMHALNYRRKKSTRRTAPVSSDELDQSQAAANRTSPSDSGIRKAAAGDTTSIHESLDDVLLKGLGGLEQTARACLLLRIVYELGYEEISQMLEIPAGTAMSHVHRCKRQLRDELSSEDLNLQSTTAKPEKDL